MDTDQTPIDPETGLDEAETICMDYLIAALNVWNRIERQHPDEVRDFVDAIHKIQGLLTTRIARRMFPVGWPKKVG